VTGFDDLEYASLSDVGVRRSHNQDNYAILLASDAEKWRLEGHLFVVADGMGAHAVGEKASELAAGIIPHTYNKHAQQGPVPALRKAFVEANASIHARGQQNREFEGMGTTGTALLLRTEGAWVAHVGDSRVYRVRAGCMEQLSFDHSLLWVYAKQQRIDPAAVHNIPSNVIVRSLGPEPLVQVDIEGPHPLQDGDIFLLCSDGLSGQISDNELGAVASTLPPEEACRFLVDLANLRGGPDNITVLIIRVGKSLETPGAGGRPKKPLSRLIPWPLPVLGLGILLAAAATGLTYLKLIELGVPVFLLAAAAVVAGVVGLFLQYQREQKQTESEDPEDRPPAKIYRQTPCALDRPLLDKLVRATQALRILLEEKKWETDWPAYQQHLAEAEKLLAANDLAGAFREYCRAMRPLAEAHHQHRKDDNGSPPPLLNGAEG
jgi:serine/threonine protein phosphatase PrpC